jgi:hypothetical protein
MTSQINHGGRKTCYVFFEVRGTSLTRQVRLDLLAPARAVITALDQNASQRSMIDDKGVSQRGRSSLGQFAGGNSFEDGQAAQFRG